VVAFVEYDPCADEPLLWGGEGKLRRPSEPRARPPPDIDFPSPLPFKKVGIFPPKKLGDILLCDIFGLFTLTVPSGNTGLSNSLDPLLLTAVVNLGIMLPDDDGRDEVFESLDPLLLNAVANLGIMLPDDGRNEIFESLDPLLLTAVDNLGITLPDDGRDRKLAGLVAPLGGCGKAAMLIVFRKILPVGLESVSAAMEVDLNVGTFEVEFACRGTGAAVDKVDIDGVRSASFEDPYEAEGSLVGFGELDGFGKLLRDIGMGKGGKATVGGLREGRDGCGSVAAMLEIFAADP